MKPQRCHYIDPVSGVLCRNLMTQQFVRPSLLKEEQQVNSCEYHAHLFQSLDVHLRAAHAKIARMKDNAPTYKNHLRHIIT